jgi:hypothetical protein
MSQTTTPHPSDPSDDQLNEEADFERIPESERPAWKAQQLETCRRFRSNHYRGGISDPEKAPFVDPDPRAWLHYGQPCTPPPNRPEV